MAIDNTAAPNATISRGPADSPVEEFKAQCSDPLMERTSDWVYT